MNRCVYIAPHECENILKEELDKKNIPIVKQEGRFFLTSGEYRPLLWAQVAWRNVIEIPITSIGDGAQKLKSLGRNWSLFTIDHHRRAKLIQEKLPFLKERVLEFLEPMPKLPMGGWTLLTPDIMIASTDTTSLYPLGEMTFNEDKINPPSRAYLKLWEFFTCHSDIRPGPQDRCLDMGSCPGGWTWVLAHGLKTQVTSVDRSPLAAPLLKYKNVHPILDNAFTLPVDKVGKIDWFFSDLICYPEKLLELVEHWMKHDSSTNFVCTIKYQAQTDFETTEKFLKIPGSSIVHLHHNKHEVTWSLIRKKS